MAELFSKRAIHFIGHRQHQVVGGDGLIRAVPGDHAHHRVGVLLSRVVVRRDGDALGVPPVDWGEDPGNRLVAGLKKAGLRDVGQARHRPTGDAIVRQERSIEKGGVGREIAFADGSGVDRPGWVIIWDASELLPFLLPGQN